MKIRADSVLKLALGVTLLILAIGPHERTAHASSFTVNVVGDGTGDSSPGDGVCSDASVVGCTLRAAIDETNALSGPDLINLPAGLFVLSTGINGDDDNSGGDLDITGVVTIHGAGVGITILEGRQDRLIHVLNGASLDASGITIRNGSSPADGGGILNEGSLKLTDVDVTNSIANFDGGGLFNNGTFDIKNTSFTDNRAIGVGSSAGSGGAIDNRGSGTINSSFLLRNSAGTQGGGIRNSNHLTVLNSAVDGNRVTGSFSGGIHNIGSLTVENSSVSENYAENKYGGIFNGGSLTLINSTVSRNTTFLAGGGIFTDGTLFIRNSTITGNSVTYAAGGGGGIRHRSGLAELVNTIVAGNAASDGPDCRGGAITSLGHNLIGTTSRCGYVSAPGDKSGNPLLGPLMDNGGRTRTHALLPSSPAINGADNSYCTAADQRGVVRPQLLQCDIGAFEFDAFSLAPDFSLDGISTTYDPTNPRAPAGVLTATGTFTNQSATDYDDVFFEVTEISGGNEILNADGGPGGVGSTISSGQDVPAGGVLNQAFEIGMQVLQPFQFVWDMFGTPN